MLILRYTYRLLNEYCNILLVTIFLYLYLFTWNQDCGQPQDHGPLSWQRQSLDVVRYVEINWNSNIRDKWSCGWVCSHCYGEDEYWFGFNETCQCRLSSLTLAIIGRQSVEGEYGVLLRWFVVDYDGLLCRCLKLFVKSGRGFGELCGRLDM